MTTNLKRTLTACLAILLALAVCGSAAAQNVPSSDLLVPYFEVDANPAGVTTLFAVGNSTEKPVDVLGTVFTNWGVPILKVPFTLQAREIRTVNLRDWFRNGGDPKQALAPSEVSHLKAAASGQRSPKDNLYYSTEVELDMEVGYVTLRTQGNRPDALWGDWFLVDVGGNLARGDVLVNIDRSIGCPGLCQRHLLRYLSGGGFDGGTDVIIWRETVGQPSSNPEGGVRLQTDATAISEPGLRIENRQLFLLPVEKVTVAELGLKEPFGALDVESEVETFIAVQHSSDNRYSVGLTTYCLPRPPNVDPGIEIVKLTNGVDANDAPGPSIPVGGAVTWEYLVRNTGGVELTGIEVTDDQGVAVSCPDDTLAPGKSMTCKANGVAEACQYANIGTATGQPPTGPEVSASDPSHYFGDEGASLSLEVLLDGNPAGTSPGAKVKIGSQLNWSFKITNKGKVRLTGIKLEGIAATCPGGQLEPGKSMTCTAKGTALSGDHSIEVKGSGNGSCSNASVDGVGFYQAPPDDVVKVPAIKIIKLTNEQDANDEPGPSIPAGSTVTWKYLVSNIGELDLNEVKVTDNKGVAVSCPKTSLKIGESMTCTGSGIAQACQYKNIGTASGKAITTGETVKAEDPSHYFGVVNPAIQVETAVNGNDADSPKGPEIAEGSALSFTYVVKNTGDVVLNGIQVTDSKGVAVTCPKTTLQPGESMTCNGGGTAIEGQYSAIGTATGKGGCDNQSVSDNDPVHYFGEPQEPGIEIVKLTNGQDANLPPGPSIAVGSTVTWTYKVTNTGKVVLSNVKVTDDKGVAVTCPKATLQPGESMTCTGSGKAQACQYANLGTATGKTPNGNTVNHSDPSHYFGTGSPAIQIKKSTNGEDANTAPGPEIAVGAPITWTYVVTNSGNVPLSDVKVSDDKGVTVTCPRNSLQPGESMTCIGNGTATEGQYKNIGSVTGQDPCGTTVYDDDPSYYFGKETKEPGIKLVKLTNGQDANVPPGPSIPVGSTVTWTYQVTNIGQIALSNVKVTDDKGVAVSCPKTTLQPGESMNCTGSGKAQACQYMNLGTATGKSPTGQTVSHSDPSHYFGTGSPAIHIKKSTNGQDANTAPGPEIAIGSPVNWTYVVTNTGNVALSGIAVSDDKGVAVSCPATTLQPGASMTCTANGIATAGQYKNIGFVSGKDSCGTVVSDDDPSHYYGKEPKEPGIKLVKLTNGQDANVAPGPSIPVGSTVTWTYQVINIGQIALSNVKVTDDKGVVVSCPKTTLQPGESMNCTGSGKAQACQYMNLGTATGKTPTGQTVSHSDPSHYFGVANPAIQVETAVNGNDADSPKGPEVAEGSTLSFTYVVKNTGDTVLSNIKVTDNKGVAVSCPKTTLQPGESMTCTGSAKAIAGQYSAVGTASGKGGCDQTVSDDDPVHYYGKPTGGDEGCTPGYWKNHEESWQSFSTSQKVSSVFSQASLYPTLGSSTLHQALGFQGGSDLTGAAGILLRAATASLLNSAHNGVDFPWFTSQVIQEVNSALASKNRDTIISLASALDKDNNLGCPLN